MDEVVADDAAAFVDVAGTHADGPRVGLLLVGVVDVVVLDDVAEAVEGDALPRRVVDQVVRDHVVVRHVAAARGIDHHGSPGVVLADVVNVVVRDPVEADAVLQRVVPIGDVVERDAATADPHDVAAQDVVVMAAVTERQGRAAATGERAGGHRAMGRQLQRHQRSARLGQRETLQADILHEHLALRLALDLNQIGEDRHRNVPLRILAVRRPEIEPLRCPVVIPFARRVQLFQRVIEEEPVAFHEQVTGGFCERNDVLFPIHRLDREGVAVPIHPRPNVHADFRGLGPSAGVEQPGIVLKGGMAGLVPDVPRLVRERLQAILGERFGQVQKAARPRVLWVEVRIAGEDLLLTVVIEFPEARCADRQSLRSAW